MSDKPDVTSNNGGAVGKHAAPERPPVVKVSSAPVVDHRPPPFLARLSQILWVFGIGLTAFTIVYMFIIRESQLELLIDLIRAIDDTRADETYATTADIIYWSLFGVLVLVVVMQLVMVMSMMNRRPGARWWLFGLLVVQTVVIGAIGQFLGGGERGELLQQVGTPTLALGGVGLLISLLPPVLRWSAARVDVRRGPIGPSGGSDL